MPTIRLYHGTAHDFTAFDSRYVLRGSEPNSALGVHLTECPAIAADYAELASRDTHAGEPRVLVVDVEIWRAALISSVDDFMGRPFDLPLDPEVTRSREEFVAARHELEAKGFHAVALDTPIDDLVGTWVVFDPDRISVVARMTPEEAYILAEHQEGCRWDGVELMPARLFEDEPDGSLRL